MRMMTSISLAPAEPKSKISSASPLEGLQSAACRERPRRRRAAEQRDELAASQWIELHSVPAAKPDCRISNWQGSVSGCNRSTPATLIGYVEGPDGGWGIWTDALPFAPWPPLWRGFFVLAERVAALGKTLGFAALST